MLDIKKKKKKKYDKNEECAGSTSRKFGPIHFLSHFSTSVDCNTDICIWTEYTPQPMIL